MYGKYSSLYAVWCDCYDPKGIELSVIKKYYDLENKDILDIGCGTGRFMIRVLPIVRSIIGIDNDVCSVEVLRQIITERYPYLLSKAAVYCGDITQFNGTKDSIDAVVFSWSFYALTEKQMVCSLSNINLMLRENGVLIILQPVGGDFEDIMRIYFEEHQDKDEYKNALELMNKVTAVQYTQLAEDRIFSEFLIKDLGMLSDALRMFAITEGGCKENNFIKINLDKAKNILEKCKEQDGYHLSDKVGIYIFEKRRK